MRLTLGVLIAALGCAGTDSNPPHVASTSRHNSVSLAAADASQAFSHSWCLADDQARLLGIGISTPPDALGALGTPLARDTTFSEDDGGRFASEALSYARLTISIDTRGWGINEVESSHPAVTLAGKVHVDMVLDSALSLLAVPASQRALADWSTTPMWEGSLCEKGDPPLLPSELATLRLYIGSDSRIVRIALTNYGP